MQLYVQLPYNITGSRQHSRIVHDLSRCIAIVLPSIDSPVVNCQYLYLPG